MADAQYSSWPDLPRYLLDQVLRRLPDRADRVRLKAVCRPWRSNAQMQPHPNPLPWLTLPRGYFLTFPGGETHCAEIHHVHFPDGARCYGSTDDSFLLVKIDGGCSLTNPFSKDTLDLPNLDTVWCGEWFGYESSKFEPLFYKLVAPSPQELSPDSLLAVLIRDDVLGCKVLVRRPPFATGSSRRTKLFRSISDVAFFGGKLYAIDVCNKLAAFEIGDITGTGSTPKISTIEIVRDSGEDDICDDTKPLPREGAIIKKYLVESSGRLLVVKRYILRSTDHASTSEGHSEHHHTTAFDVYEVDLSRRPAPIRRVNKLCGHAIFVGQNCSKVIPTGETGGAQEHCIYFMCDYLWPDHLEDPLCDSGVYNMRTGMIAPLLPGTVVPPHRVGQYRPAWFYPA